MLAGPGGVFFPADPGSLRCIACCKTVFGAAPLSCCCPTLPSTLHSLAVEQLRRVEEAFAALAATARSKSNALTQDVLALDHLLSLLFAACTRVRRVGGWVVVRVGMSLVLLSSALPLPPLLLLSRQSKPSLPASQR